MASKKVRLKHWDPAESLKPTSTIIILGKRGTGKSTIIQSLCYILRHKIDAALAFSPTEDAQGSLGRFIPPSCIHEEWDEDVLASVLEAQRAHLKRGKERNVFVIADDVAYDKSAFRGKSLRNCFMNGRHRRTGIIMTAQYAIDIPTAIRANADVIIACRETVYSNLEKLWKSFFGHFNSLRDFVTAFRAVTNNYEVMVCVTSSSNSLEDSIFWWKADPTQHEFRIGSPAMWAMHHRVYVEDKADEQSEQVEKLM